MLNEILVGFMGYLEWLPIWVVVILAIPILYKLQRQYASNQTVLTGGGENLGIRFFYLVTVTPLLFLKTVWAYSVSGRLVAWIPDVNLLAKQLNTGNIGTVGSGATSDFPWTENNLVVNWLLLFALLVTFWIIILMVNLIIANLASKTNREATTTLSFILLVFAVITIGGAVASLLGVTNLQFDTDRVWDLLAFVIAVPLSTATILFLQDKGVQSRQSVQ